MSPLLMFFSFLSPLLLFFYLAHNILSSNNKDGQLPPSPPKLPIIGNLHQFGSQPHRALRTLSEKYGPLMFLKLGSVPTIVVSSAEMAREVMKTQDQIFASRPSLAVPRLLLYNSTDVGFAPYGEYWRQVRKISVLHLLSAKKVQSFRSVREEEVALTVERIAKEFSSSGRAVDLSKMLNSMSNDIISRVTLGKKYYGDEGNNARFCELVEENSALTVAFHVGDFFPRFGWLSKLSGLEARMKRQWKRWDEFLNEVIDDHLLHRRSRAADHQDLVDVLLCLRRDESLTMDNVKAILVDMFGAGTDTSYITIEWTMAELVQNPIEIKKVQEEIRRVVAGKTMVEEEDLSKMLYLRAVIKEVLRLHPPAPLLIPRESIDPTHIEGFKIPAKTRIIINAWAIGRNSKSWVAPEKFLPERFISSPIDYKGHDFQYIPFGAGRRICPGMLFAISTVELALANLLYHFDWSLPDGKNPEYLDMSEGYGITVRMKSGLLLLASPHNSNIKSI